MSNGTENGQIVAAGTFRELAVIQRSRSSKAPGYDYSAIKFSHLLELHAAPPP